MQSTSRIGSRASLIGLALSAWLVATVGFSQSAPSAFTTAYRYNMDGQVTAVILPYSGTGTVSYLTTRNTYNPQGLLVSVEHGALSVWQPENVDPATWASPTPFTVFTTETYGYDWMGQMLWKQVSSGGTAYELTQYSYDVLERQQCVATRMNPAQFGSTMPGACTLSTPGNYGPDRITYTTYDSLNRPVTIQRAYGTSLQETYKTNTYTADGLINTVQDANGNLTTNTYDGQDRLKQMQFPSKTTPGTSSTTDLEQYTYDDNNNRAALVTRDSQTITYSYDALNRMSSKLWPSSWGVSVYYGYDLRSLRLYANYGSPTGLGVSSTYDGFGHVHTETVNLSGTAQQMVYQYDADGNRTQVSYPDTNYITYTYDGLDRLSQVLETGSSVLAGYSYDSAGRLQQLTRGGGVTTTALGYDPVSRLNSLSHTLATSLDNISFSPFGYNPASQLVSLSISNAEYDPLAKSATQSYTPNGLNQYTVVGGVSFSWDPRGNLTSDGSTTYSYDLENRLTAASGAHTASLSYDPLGRLYQTTSGSATTTFVYDGDRITAELDGSSNLLRRYAYGLAGDNPLLWYEGAGFGQANRRYLHSDHQGSIIAVTDSYGTTLGVNQYDPYGVRNSLNQGRFQYTGQAYIPELGLYYYKARMYDAALGRFMQTDPIGYEDDLDLYAYVGNDPTDRADPSGKYVDAMGGYYPDDNSDNEKGFAAPTKDFFIVGGGAVGLTAACAAGGCAAAGYAAAMGAVVNGIGTALQGGTAPDVALASGLGASSSLETAGAGALVKSGDDLKAVVTGVANAATTLQGGGTVLQAAAAGATAAAVQSATKDMAKAAAAGSAMAKIVGNLAVQGVRKTATFEAKAATKPQSAGTPPPPPPQEFRCGAGEDVSCGK